MTGGARARSRVGRSALAVAIILVALAALVAWLNVRGEDRLDPTSGTTTGPASANKDVVDRGAYLARAGNCLGCHTDVGGEPFAGGRGVETPFGTVYAPNITPDPATGIGAWSAGEFWRALHNGRSKDGRLLYPAFPYPSFTLVTRDDADALYAYLRSVKAVRQRNQPHALGFPFSTQAALAVWRALFFKPGSFAAEPQQGAAWNRGKYLVQGLGHCAACHSTRNLLGGVRLNAEFAGGLMPNEAWYAPSLASPKESGVQGWPRDEVMNLLKAGASVHAAVAGPMAEVVYASTQYFRDADIEAMTLFLASIPRRDSPAKDVERARFDVMQRGRKLYADHCAACHGEKGEGVPSIYPALAGSRAVTLDSTNNLVQIIRKGGFPPSTAGNPQPFGMPPFGPMLSNDEIAAVITYVRQSWGNWASAVTPRDVQRVR